MRTKILSKPILLSVAFLGLTLSVVLFLFFISKNSTFGSSVLIIENDVTLQNQEQIKADLPAPLENTSANYELPVRIKIPSINVDAPFEYVGLTPDGAMDIPKAPDAVAWFNLGPRPGENGSAVVAGHYGWENNLPAVFDDLHKLRKGDKISVEDEEGVTTTFVVSKLKIYGKDESAPDVFGSNDGKAHLNLITCTGDWNKGEKTYSERLVVFTDKE